MWRCPIQHSLDTGIWISAYFETRFPKHVLGVDHIIVSHFNLFICGCTSFSDMLSSLSIVVLRNGQTIVSKPFILHKLPDLPKHLPVPHNVYFPQRIYSVAIDNSHYLIWIKNIGHYGWTALQVYYCMWTLWLLYRYYNIYSRTPLKQPP